MHIKEVNTSKPFSVACYKAPLCWSYVVSLLARTHMHMIVSAFICSHMMFTAFRSNRVTRYPRCAMWHLDAATLRVAKSDYTCVVTVDTEPGFSMDLPSSSARFVRAQHQRSSATCGSIGVAVTPPVMVPPKAVRWMTRPLLPPAPSFLGVLVRLSGSGVLHSMDQEACHRDVRLAQGPRHVSDHWPYFCNRVSHTPSHRRSLVCILTCERRGVQLDLRGNTLVALLLCICTYYRYFAVYTW